MAYQKPSIQVPDHKGYSYPEDIGLDHFVDYSVTENVPRMTETDMAFGNGYAHMIRRNFLPPLEDINPTWIEFFNKLFYGAPEGMTFEMDMRDDLNDETGHIYYNFLISVMKSYLPKHQQKEHFCAYYLSLWLKGWKLIPIPENKTEGVH